MRWRRRGRRPPPPHCPPWRTIPDSSFPHWTARRACIPPATPDPARTTKKTTPNCSRRWRAFPTRRAFYYAALAFVETPDDPAPVFAEGFWRGEILREPRGDGGFGYDPLFYDSSVKKTGAQMSVCEKNAVSHRGQSLRALTQALARRRQK